MKRAAALLVLAVATSAPAASAPPSWQPAVGAAAAYASHRRGVIAFAVRTETRSWGWHATRTFPSASVLKAMLLVAYLNLPAVRARPLGPRRQGAAGSDDPPLRQCGRGPGASRSSGPDASAPWRAGRTCAASRPSPVSGA